MNKYEIVLCRYNAFAGKASISEAVVAAAPTMVTLLPNKYFAKTSQNETAEKQISRDSTAAAVDVDVTTVNTTHALLLATGPSPVTTTTVWSTRPTKPQSKQSRKSSVKGHLNHIFDTISYNNKHHHHDHK